MVYDRQWLIPAPQGMDGMNCAITPTGPIAERWRAPSSLLDASPGTGSTWSNYPALADLYVGISVARIRPHLHYAWRPPSRLHGVDIAAPLFRVGYKDASHEVNGLKRPATVAQRDSALRRLPRWF